MTMKTIALAALFTLASATSHAALQAPATIIAQCGLQFIALNANPQSILVDYEDVEGSEVLDAGQVEMKLVKTEKGVAAYESTETVLFTQGAPSFKFTLGFKMNTEAYTPANDKWGATLDGSTAAYLVKNNQGKVVGKGQLSQAKTLLGVAADGTTIQWISHHMEKNGSFKTSQRQGVFRCEFAK